MKRFIFIAFAFLGFAFYELSGGSGFDPTQTRLDTIEVRQQLELARRDTAPIAVATLVPAVGKAPIPATSGQTGTSRTGLKLVSFENAASLEPLQETAQSGGDTLENVAAQSAIVPEVEAPLDTPKQLTGFSAIDGEGSGISFAGLSSSASSEDVALPKDIRLVSGSLVNLRAGPGSGFDVVAQFPEDTRVEVLEDAGNGWVQLRPVDGGPTGWMADFLLADG